MNNEIIESNKVSYWESRKINIGDYEDTQFGLSINHSIITPVNGYGDKKLQISYSASIDAKTLENINEVSDTLIKVVRKKLNAVEKVVRTQIAEWEGISYDAEKKLVARKIIKEEEYSGKHKDRFNITDDDLA